MIINRWGDELYDMYSIKLLTDEEMKIITFLK